jgi:hypothetical protein
VPFEPETFADRLPRTSRTTSEDGVSWWAARRDAINRGELANKLPGPSVPKGTSAEKFGGALKRAAKEAARQSAEKGNKRTEE